VLYARTRALLVVRGLKATHAVLRAPASRAGSPDGTAIVARGRQLADTTARVLQRFPRDERCIVESLVLTGVLARRGINSTLLIGIDPGTDFAARAWVEVEGVPLGESGGLHRLLEF
jgi:hypothetical protein